MTNKYKTYRQGDILIVALIHPEHAQVALMPGTYEVIRQHEFQRKEVVRVQD